MTDDLPRRIYPPEGDVYVAPRYLAGSNGTGDAGFAPVAHWPHHDLGDGPCQLLVTSPDHRIRIGRYGDDFELWAGPPGWGHAGSGSPPTPRPT
ncbi:hypothetical protein [Streptomyces sp. SJL17-1]|uniref:hypothetical protein n=1 Tax=unclassified Streptomyces TaxID=2593676 RepID=UPI00399004BB